MILFSIKWLKSAVFAYDFNLERERPGASRLIIFGIYALVEPPGWFVSAEPPSVPDTMTDCVARAGAALVGPA
jgi:hypothetical protein